MTWTFGEIKNDLPTDPYNPFWDEKLKETKGGESIEDVFFSVEDVRVREYREKTQNGIDLFATYFCDLWD